MNQTIKNQLEHRSIRKWKKDKISEDTIKTLFEVANRTASSTAMQQYSIIRVKDSEKRREFAEITGQSYIEDVPELFIFILDCFRNYKIMKEQNEDYKTANDANRFFQGFTDGCIAAQNLTVAVESLGMGAVYFGSILNDIKRVIQMLKLPKLTFPIVGVGFGYPDQTPELKPRMNAKDKYFTDEYKIFDSYLDEIREYDERLNSYYDLRDTIKPVPTFSKQVLLRLQASPNPDNYPIKLIKEQGFEF